MNITKTLDRAPHFNSLPTTPIHMETPSHPENNKLFHSLDVNHMYMRVLVNKHIHIHTYVDRLPMY